MSEGWQHVVDDLRAALGLPAPADRRKNDAPAAGLHDEAILPGISGPLPGVPALPARPAMRPEAAPGASARIRAEALRLWPKIT